jgi:hypothetical protein
VLLVRGLTAARLSWRNPERVRAALIGFAMLSAWIAAIHTQTYIPPPLAVLLSMATVGAAIGFERALARAEGRIAVSGREAAAPARRMESRSEIGATPAA